MQHMILIELASLRGSSGSCLQPQPIYAARPGLQYDVLSENVIEKPMRMCVVTACIAS